MRTPGFDVTASAATFDAAQWQNIKTVFAAVSINLDTATLPATFNKPWWLPADATTLRDAIQAAARHYGLQLHVNAKPRTANQQATMLTETLAAYTAALDRTNRVDRGDDRTFWQPAKMFLLSRIQRQATLQGALMLEIADLKGRIAGLNAAPSASPDNAKTIRNDYWREQARLWQALKPAVGPFRRKHLRNFLRACSWPLPSWHPNMTEQELDAALGHFIKNYFRPKLERGKRRLK
jgi:hypothetical protein